MIVEKIIGSNVQIDKFNPPHPLNTAVLFLVFNRPDTTKQVFEAIRKAKPPRLYVAADSAREAKESEGQKVKEVREYIISNIDWDCEVKTLFREQNLGCKIAVSGAVDWFFENEEMGIILEDDCLPSQSFFWFCEKLLEKYKEDMRVGQISGDNFQKGIKRGGADYYFSIYSHIWGWASWANRWQNYDVSLNSFNDAKFIEEIFDKKSSKRYWIGVFKNMKAGGVDTWDYQWVFTLWKTKQLTVLPNINLIENIGFGESATHTTGESEFSNLKACEIVLNKHPKNVERDIEADEFTAKCMFSKKSFPERVVNKVRRLLK
jgi:hypothetical protein